MTTEPLRTGQYELEEEDALRRYRELTGDKPPAPSYDDVGPGGQGMRPGRVNVAALDTAPTDAGGFFRQAGGNPTALSSELNITRTNQNARALNALSDDMMLKVLRESGLPQRNAEDVRDEVRATFRPRPSLSQAVNLAMTTGSLGLIPAFNWTVAGAARVALGGGAEIAGGNLPSLGEAKARGEQFPGYAKFLAEVGVTAPGAVAGLATRTAGVAAGTVFRGGQVLANVPGAARQFARTTLEGTASGQRGSIIHPTTLAYYKQIAKNKIDDYVVSNEGGVWRARHTVTGDVVFGTNRGRQAAITGAIETLARARRYTGEAGRLSVGELAYGAGRASAQLARSTRDALKDFIGSTDAPPGPFAGDAAVQKLTAVVKGAKVEKRAMEVERGYERSRRVSEMADILSDPSVPSSLGSKAVTAPLAGELPSRVLKFAEQPLTSDELYGLIDKLRFTPLKATFQTFDRLNTWTALEELVLRGKIPRDFELELFERFFGKEFTQAIRAHRPFSAKALQVSLEAINAPRALMATLDMSAPLRQGILLAPSQPRQYLASWGPMVRAWSSEKYARMVDDAISSGPGYTRRAQAKLFKANLYGEAAPLIAREEAVVSRALSKVPGVRASERAYVTFLNKLRADSFDAIVDNAAKAGRELDDEFMHSVARYVNIASGRGSVLGHDAAALIMNATFFSPRFLMSRLQLPTTAVTGTARVQALRGMVSYAGALATALYLSHLAGAEVELDPRSSDFGKMKIGNSRYDFGGGYLQLVRLGAQLSTGEKKSLSDGDVRDIANNPVASRFIAAWYFARSKFSPTAGSAVDLATGRTFSGEELGAHGIDKELLRYAPLAMQDIMEAIELEGGMLGFAKGAPSIFGAGVTTFKTTGDVRQEVAQEKFGKDYESLEVGFQKEVNADPRVQKAQDQYKPPPQDPKEQVRYASERYEQVKLELEGKLKAALDAGATGDVLRKAVQDFLGDRFFAADTLYGEAIDAYLKGDKSPTVADAIAERYWSVALEQDPATGAFDFTKRKEMRERALADADAAGVSRRYITGTGEGTYLFRRGIQDDGVLKVVQDYMALQETFERLDWRRLYKQMPDVLEGKPDWAVRIYEAAERAHERNDYRGWLEQQPDPYVAGKAYEQVQERVRLAQHLYRARNVAFDRAYTQFFDAVPLTTPVQAEVARRLAPRRQLEVLHSGFESMSTPDRGALLAVGSGFDTLEKIAAATPEALAQVVPGRDADQIREWAWIEQAQAILRALRQTP